MVATTQLDAAEFAAALRAVGEVVAEHAAALDLLDHGEGALDDLPGDDAVVVPPGVGTHLSVLFEQLAASVAGARTFAELVAAAEIAAPAGASAGVRDLERAVAALLGSLGNADALDAGRLALGLEMGAEAVAAEDDGGHAGCLAAVAAAAADGALASLDAGGSLQDVVVAAADDGLAELEAGPTANPALQERGVVDAAAAGLLLALDALASVVTGEPLPAAPRVVVATDTEVHRYQVTCRVEPHGDGDPQDAAWLESVWHEISDEVHLSCGGGSWAARVVTATPGAVVEAIAEIGRPRELRISLAGSGATGD